MPKSSKWSRSEGNSLPSAKWFDFTMVDDDFEELQRGFVPKETNTDTKKCVKLFNDWASAMNHYSSSTIERVPNDILFTDDHGLLSQWLAKFCTEARKQGGEQYPPKTIQHYLMGLQRHIRTQKKEQCQLYGGHRVPATTKFAGRFKL